MVHYFRSVWGIDEGATYRTEENEKLRVGRAPTNDVVLAFDRTASGEHALLKESQGVLYLSDLNSTNGTFLQGERLIANRQYRVRDFFTFATTHFVRVSNGPRVSSKPLPLSRASAWHQVPLFKRAVHYMKDLPFMGSAHLFLALMEENKKRFEPFLRRLKVESIAKMAQQTATGTFFSGDYSWMNLTIDRAIQAHEGQSWLTPLAQWLLHDYQKNNCPYAFLALFLQDDFNVVHALLDWQKSKASWKEAQEDLAPTRSVVTTMLLGEEELEDSRIYKRMWEKLAAIADKGRIPVLMGSPGNGKSHIFRRAAHGANEQLLKPPLKTTPIRLKDPKQYLLYHSPKSLGAYLRELSHDLQGSGLILLDHLGHLMNLISQNHGDSHTLATHITNRAKHLVLACERQYVNLLVEHLPSIQIFDLDEYLAPHLPAIYKTLLNNFQKEIAIPLSPQSRTFFVTQVTATCPRNIKRLNEFLKLCRARIHETIATPLGSDDKTRAIGRMSDSLFREIHQDWINVASTGHAPQTSAKETEVLLEIEAFLKNISQRLVKVPMRYGPAPGSFATEDLLPRDHKLDMLKVHLFKMIGSLKGGFNVWFEDFWNQISPQALRQEHGKSPTTLWREYEKRARNIDLGQVEEEMREACKGRWSEDRDFEIGSWQK